VAGEPKTQRRALSTSYLTHRSQKISFGVSTPRLPLSNDLMVFGKLLDAELGR
jgi:hypothetical protein